MNLAPLPAPPSANRFHQPNDTAETRLQRTLFIVQATSNEQHEFWRRYSMQGRSRFTNSFVKLTALLDAKLIDSPQTNKDQAYEALTDLLEAVKMVGSFSHEPVQSWEQVSPGWLVQVGELNGRPINLDMQWVSIDGFLVCFYDAVSGVVDHTQIDKWLRKHFKGKWDHNTRWAHCDSSNFHHCMDAISQAKKGEHNKPLPRQPPKKTDVTPNKYFTPLTDERLFELAKRIRPVYRPNKVVPQLMFVKPTGRNGGLNNDYLRCTAFLWDAKPDGPAKGLKPIRTVRTYHTYGYHGMFKPDISEALAQIPADIIDKVVAFEITQSPSTAADLNKEQEALNAGFHVAEITYYGS